MADIRQCPRCNLENFYRYPKSMKNVFIECTSCGYKTNIHSTLQLAIEEWNNKDLESVSTLGLNIITDKNIRMKLKRAFPKSFINMNLEFICHPARNSYFLLEDVTSELILKCKVLEWLSREASKSPFPASREYHLAGINSFLDKGFTPDGMDLIYTKLGNSVNRPLTIKFIESKYNFEVLEK